MNSYLPISECTGRGSSTRPSETWDPAALLVLVTGTVTGNGTCFLIPERLPCITALGFFSGALEMAPPLRLMRKVSQPTLRGDARSLRLTNQAFFSASASSPPTLPHQLTVVSGQWYLHFSLSRVHSSPFHLHTPAITAGWPTFPRALLTRHAHQPASQMLRHPIQWVHQAFQP